MSKTINKTKLIWLIVTFVCYYCFRKSKAEDMQDARYFKQTICDMEKRIAGGCFNRMSSVRGLIDCLTICNHDDACIGASVNKNGSACYIRKTCQDESSCEHDSDVYDYYSKNCDNGGKWNPNTKLCVCRSGWVGDRCSKRPKHCDELMKYENIPSAYRVKLDLTDKGLPDVEVICKNESIATGASSIVLMRNTGDKDNSMSMDRYVRGFESADGHNMWLGLEKWHILSKAGYSTVTVSTKFQDGSNVCTLAWIYEKFNLSGGNHKYKFLFQSSFSYRNGICGEYQMGDCFRHLRMVPFSTEDVDNDFDAWLNCAQLRGSGWWLRTCTESCNLLGYHQKYSGSKPAQKLIKLAGIDSKEMLKRLTYIEITLTNGA